MKMNNKGYASTIIMFSVLALFLVSMLMLIQTMNNSKSLNKNITDKVTDNIDYSASGSLRTEIDLLKQQMSNLVDKMYPVGSIYMTTTYSEASQVHDAIGGEWEKYAQGRTIIGEGTGTDSNGLVKTFENNVTDGEYAHTLSSSEIASHTHSIPSLSGTTGSIGSGYSLHHTCETRTTNSGGSHSHRSIANTSYGITIYKKDLNVYRGRVSSPSSGSLYTWISPVYDSIGYYEGDTSTSGAHTHTYPDCYLDSLSGVQSHSHTFSTGVSTTGSTGENTAHNNMEPYIVTYIYKRIK
jgi:microcystin-dependent protein